MKKRADDAGGAHSDGAGGRQRGEDAWVVAWWVDADTGRAGRQAAGRSVQQELGWRGMEDWSGQQEYGYNNWATVLLGTGYS